MTADATTAERSPWDRFAPDAVRERVRSNIAERGLACTLAGAYTDPGAYTPRGDDYQEPIHEWATRAIEIVLANLPAAAEARAVLGSQRHAVVWGLRRAAEDWRANAEDDEDFDAVVARQLDARADRIQAGGDR